MSKKCVYFDRGFCKKQKQLSSKASSHDCQGKCEDMNTCPKRHRTECKNGSTCLFRKTNSCEFLHSEAWDKDVRNSEIETLQMVNDGQGAGLSYLEENIKTLEKITKQSAENLKALEA